MPEDPPAPPPRSRIQTENRARILASALEAFSDRGFHGAPLDRIAEGAGMSKPNLIYYFPTKEALHEALLSSLLDDWIAPLRDLSAAGDPMREIRAYLRRKLDMARERPRDSRLFAAEVMAGAPRMRGVLAGELKALVDDKAAVIRAWIAQGRLRQVDPHHLIFSIWAVTQHYADFDVQVRLVLGLPDNAGDGHVDDAARFLETLYLRGLAPDPAAPPGASMPRA